MTLTVHKYPVAETDYFDVPMPEGAKILTVQAQHGAPEMWVLVDVGRPDVQRHFRLAGTGHPIKHHENLEYIGTYQLMGGRLVFHLFEDLSV